MGQWANQFGDKKERLRPGPLASCGLAHQAAAPPLSSYNGTVGQWANQFRGKKERLRPGPLASCGLALQAAAPPLSSYNQTAD
jgi:hypothetical protein